MPQKRVRFVEAKEDRLYSIWPREGKNGKKPRGFFAGLKDCMTNKGPDIYVQKGLSKKPLRVGEWSNWDSYHLHESCERRRGNKRYDPHSRKYVDWSLENQWAENLNGREPLLPRFHAREFKKLERGNDLRGIDSEWDDFGPKRFRLTHDEFWRQAHRVGRNIFEGLDPQLTAHPHFDMHQVYDSEPGQWYRQQVDLERGPRVFPPGFNTWMGYQGAPGQGIPMFM